MRKSALKIWSVLLGCLTICQAKAEVVPDSVIRTVAANAYKYYTGSTNLKDTIRDLFPLLHHDTTVMYLCNFSHGFIIVSADDVAYPVLAFCDESPADTANLAPAVKYLLERYGAEICSAQQKKSSTSAQNRDEWQKLIDYDTKSYYAPCHYMLQTQWGQSGGQLAGSAVTYNYFCPKDEVSGIRTLVGCGAVAMAQILHYWTCDVCPHGTIHNSHTDTTINLSGQNYEWFNMSSHHADSHNAKLLADCAVAINSNFGTNVTYSSIETIKNILKNNYGFANATVGYSRTDTAWAATLQSALSQRCPIIYAGYSENNTAGHAWVIDGYDNNGLFHCNFGWRGDYNAWYRLTDITPGSHTFNVRQSAILDLYPTAYSNNVELIDTTVTSGTYGGHKIILQNSNVQDRATVTLDASCATDIYGPFSILSGATLDVR